MVELQSIEQLLYFMKSHIHLSRYDEKFLENIATLKTVTTNQVILLHKLIFKYRRQFVKHEMFVEKLVDLPWGVTVIESSPQYTDGHVSIINDTIYFKCPFNRNFIDAFKKTTLNKYTWNKTKRYYEAPYNVYTLKILISTASKFFQHINFCPTTQSLLKNVEMYKDIIYWQPTLVKYNDNFFIVACNAILDEALGNLKLSNDIDTLLTLSKHGVVIDKSFYENNAKLKFISEYNATIEHGDIDKVVDWLKEIKCDMVFISGISMNLSKKNLITQLDKNKIEYCDLNTTISKSDKNHNCPVFVKFKRFSDGPLERLRVSKIITIVNSTPIEVK